MHITEERLKEGGKKKQLESKTGRRARVGEKHSVRSIASLWSDIIMCSSSGRSPRLARVWEMARDITRYRTWLRKKKMDKVKTRCASGTEKSRT